MTVRDRDRGARALLKRLERRPVVRVGVMGSEAAEAKRGGSGADTVVDIATIHEFGLGVPRRSFIADTADETETEARRRLGKAAIRVLKRGKLSEELDKFGLWMVGKIQKRFSRRIPPKLAQATVDRKGSDVPLIDTGQLRSSITHEIGYG